MDLIGDDPVLNLTDGDFRVFSKNRARPPQYIGPKSSVENSLICEGCRINGSVKNSILSGGVVIESGATVEGCVIMEDVTVKSGAVVYNAIIDAGSVIESGSIVGVKDGGTADITVLAMNSHVDNKNTVNG